MDTELLKTFLEVEKTRHFGRAAENLYLTPAAVSARIRQLEGIIGIPLLTRNRKHIGLTPAGERLKPRAEEVLDALARAIAEPSAMPKAPQQLSIGGTPNLWEYCLTRQLQLIRDANPDLSLRAECHDSGYLISQLQSRQLDVAFLFDPIELEGMSCEQVATIELVLFSTVESVAAGELGTQDYVLVDWSVGFGIEHDRHPMLDLEPVLACSTGKIALDYLAVNGGCAYFPASVERDDRARASLHRVPGAPIVELGLYLLHLSSNRKKPLIESLKTAGSSQGR